MKYAVALGLLVAFECVSAQRIVAVDTLTNRTRYIEIGKVLGVTTGQEKMGDYELFNHLVPNSQTGASIWSPDGTWRLTAIDTVQRSITLTYQEQDLSKSFSFDDIRYLTYLRAKHPWQLRNYRISATILGIALASLGAAGFNDNRPLAISLLTGGTGFIASTIILKDLGKPRGYWFRKVIK